MKFALLLLILLAPTTGFAFAEVYEMNDGSKMVMWLGTNKETYNVGDDLEIEFKTDQPTVGWYNIQIVFPDGSVTEEEIIDVGIDGINNSILEYVDFWTEDTPPGKYIFEIRYLTKTISKEVYFENEHYSIIPAWIKNNAGWWANDQIDDGNFIQGIQFLIKEKIILVEPTPNVISAPEQKIPEWVKNNAGWWAENKIDDHTFLSGIQFLVNNGIISVNEPVQKEKPVATQEETKPVWKPVDTSRLDRDDWFWDDQEYWDKVEKQTEDYLLNYKGKDNAGLTMEEARLALAADVCGIQVWHESANTQLWVQLVGYDDTVKDKALTVVLHMMSKDVCAQGAWWYGIDPKTGEVFAWEEAAGKEMLEFLDEFD